MLSNISNNSLIIFNLTYSVKFGICLTILFEITILITIQTMFYINSQFLEYYKKQIFTIMLFLFIIVSNANIPYEKRSKIIMHNDDLTYKIYIFQIILISLNIAVSNRLFYTKLRKYP